MLGHQVLQVLLLCCELLFSSFLFCTQLCDLCRALCLFVLHLLHTALQVHYRCICNSNFLFRIKLAALALLVFTTHLFQYEFLFVKCLAFFIYCCAQRLNVCLYFLEDGCFLSNLLF